MGVFVKQRAETYAEYYGALPVVALMFIDECLGEPGVDLEAILDALSAFEDEEPTVLSRHVA